MLNQHVNFYDMFQAKVRNGRRLPDEDLMRKERGRSRYDEHTNRLKREVSLYFSLL